MRRLLLAVAAAAAAAATARPQPPAGATVRYVVEAKDARRVTGVITYRACCPDMRAAEWLVYAAVAPELPGQVRTKTTLSPAATPARDRNTPARCLLFAKIPASTTELQTAVSVRVCYEATLRSRTLVELPAGAAAPKVAALSPADRTRYLADHGDIDFNHEAVQKWFRAEGLVRATGEDEVAFARAVFLKVRARVAYTYSAAGDRRASAVCAAGRSDCGGMAVVFAAVMRANGVPARALYGRWAASADPAERIGELAYLQWHVKAEFYAAGVGWVPVDPGGAVQHDRSPAGLAYFGADPGDFLAFHVDPTLVLDTGPFGFKTVPNLQTPAWWANGRGSTAPARVTEDWKVEVR